jgi:hypothetical protein
MKELTLEQQLARNQKIMAHVWSLWSLLIPEQTQLPVEAPRETRY